MVYLFVSDVSEPERKYHISDILLNPKTLTLFQTWVSRNTNVKYLYDCSLSFKRDYPEFNYRLFDDLDMKRFIRQFYPPAVAERYDSILPSAFKSDFFRYLFLYKFGGLYFDITLLSHQPLTKFLDIHSYDFISAIDLFYTDTNQLYQAFMYVRKQHPYMKECIDRIMSYDITDIPRKHCLSYTGPKLIGNVVNSTSVDSKNLFLRHVDGTRVVIDNTTHTDNVIIFTKGNVTDQNIKQQMYSEAQKQHYSMHCTMNTIFYY
jgi:mannosyltransferase OCH1-like enzyme